MKAIHKDTRPSISQRVLISLIAVIFCFSIAIITYTNKILHSIESGLPSTLLTELNSLANTLDSLTEVAASARIAAITRDPAQIAGLRAAVDNAYRLIVDLRNTYVANNLINASAFHAVVAPAIADVQIWLDEGVSGWGPDSTVTLSLIETRITETLHKAAKIKNDSRASAESVLTSQRRRLEAFQDSVNALLAVAVLLLCLLIYLLARQRTVIIRASEAKGALQQQHDLLENLLHHLPQGIAVWDRDLNILHLNSSFTSITGYDSNDLPNIDRWAALAYPDPAYRKKVAAHWKTFKRDGSACEYRVTCKDGKIKDIEFRAAYLPDARIINTLTDVTERNIKERELQERRRLEIRSRKMESLGQLAGGVAHDLNNILSGIVSYPELILLELAEDHPLRRPIALMRETGLRATAIVQDLLTVARGVAAEKEPININAIVEEYLGSPDFHLVQQYHPGVRMEHSLAADPANIIGSRVHIRKIVMNLVSNAFEAIDASGIVRVTTANVTLDDHTDACNGVEKGEYVTLAVADQGKGISEEDMEKIFEPFYSKKVMGRSGTGLGLTVVWNVVQDHQGHITVDSSPAGTVFTVFLPVTDKQERQLQSTTDFSAFSGNGERILVVDDVPAQRHITCSIVEKLGYTVQSVPSGEAAVEFLRRQPVDLVILDMIMSPGINGRETYEQIIRMYPGQKAVIVSGFAETEDVRETLRLGAGTFLRKPLTILELAIALHTLLATNNEVTKNN